MPRKTLDTSRSVIGYPPRHHSESARFAYYKSISGSNWGEANNYDLMLDSSVGLDASVNAICEFLKSRSE